MHKKRSAMPDCGLMKSKKEKAGAVVLVKTIPTALGRISALQKDDVASKSPPRH
jgi:hypothetical protein